MANVYDICNLVFGGIAHNYSVEIREFGDSIEIITDVVIDSIDRGWIGDITFNFDGYNICSCNTSGHDAHESFALKDVLCCRRTFEKNDGGVVGWTYSFLKY